MYGVWFVLSFFVAFGLQTIFSPPKDTVLHLNHLTWINTLPHNTAPLTTTQQRSDTSIYCCSFSPLVRPLNSNNTSNNNQLRSPQHYSILSPWPSHIFESKRTNTREHPSISISISRFHVMFSPFLLTWQHLTSTISTHSPQPFIHNTISHLSPSKKRILINEKWRKNDESKKTLWHHPSIMNWITTLANITNMLDIACPWIDAHTHVTIKEKKLKKKDKIPMYHQ